MSEQREHTGAAPAEAASITGYVDPEGEAPWAMQLVVRIEKSNPPTRTAVCEAAATAVVRLLADDRTLAGGDWADAVDRWTTGRIRKHCRRARGAAWAAVQALDGVTVDVDGAQVRAFVPGPVDLIPRPIGKLQLSGSELGDPDLCEVVEPVETGLVVVSLCPDPFLPVGKAAAAAGHAAQLAAAQMPADGFAAWAATRFAVRVEQPTVDRWAYLRTVAPVEIVDAGLTVVASGTATALARWA